MRYWHIDSPEYHTLLLLDKGYYDYDYEHVKEKAKRHEQSEERTQRMMDRFGFGKVKSLKSEKDTAEELQKRLLEEETI